MSLPLFFTEQQVRDALCWADLLTVQEQALIAFSTGKARQPVRTAINLIQENAYLLTMPAFLADPPALGVKLITICPQNPARGLPSHPATIVLIDPDTGRLLAILEGEAITEARTAAVSALSVKALAREDASVLAILGSGPQARSHLQALRHMRSFSEIRAWSPTAAHLSSLVEGAGIKAAGSAEDAVREADVIVLATSSSSPVIRREWVRPGAHVVSIGAPRPHQREMDSALVKAARIFVDSYDAAQAESGDIRDSNPMIAAELGEVLAGLKPGRQGLEEITIFKSLGLAVEDVATATLVLKSRGIA